MNINVKNIPNLTDIRIKSANTNLLSQSITAITKKDDTYTIAATGPTGNVYPSITFEYGNISQKYVKSKLNIVSYKKKDNKKIGYICVSSKKKNKQIVTNILDKVKDANGNDVENPIFTRIKTEINNQYSDAGVYFSVQKDLGNIEIDFDTNDNGIMDGKSAITGFTFGEELSVIKNYIMALPAINNYDFIVVFVNNPGNKAVGATNVTINKEIWGIVEDVKDKICFVFPRLQ